MRIRKYLILSIICIFISIIFFYQYYRKSLQTQINKSALYEYSSGVYRIAKSSNNNIQLYNTNGFNDIDIKGVRLSSFYPNYEINKSNINSSKLEYWLELISELGVNVIIVPYIQPIGFYDGVYNYNLKHDKKIYMIHEIALPIDVKDNKYNAFDNNFYSDLSIKIKDTIDVVHGDKILIGDNTHKGIYIKDVSKYNLGFIIGSNTIPELVALTNSKNKEINNFKGSYYSIENALAFDVFMTKILDYTKTYEMRKYKQNSILSYLTTIETDPFTYENESKLTQLSNIDINKINTIGEDLFTSLVAQPNDPDFMDFEDMLTKDTGGNFYSTYLKKSKDYYKYPLIITEVGVSSSRGKSKINISEGYNRGNYNELQQGELIVDLLKMIKSADINGVFIDSFQDNWGRNSSFNLKRVINKDISSYWYDTQASDNGFGLVSFVDKNNKNFNSVSKFPIDFSKQKSIISDNGISLKANADTSYLYLQVTKDKLNFNEDSIYIGIDTLKNNGSKYYMKEDINMLVDADFIVLLDGYNTSRIVVHERYNVFNYQYKYNESILDKQSSIPNSSSNIFSAIYLLNRKKFLVKNTNSVEETVYYETGNLKYGSLDENNTLYNSLTDFSINNDTIEIRIPYTMLNFKDPINKVIQGDFYVNGLGDEKIISDINFSITLRNKNSEDILKTGTYKLPDLRNHNYDIRLKQSYYILKSFWHQEG